MNAAANTFSSLFPDGSVGHLVAQQLDTLAAPPLLAGEPRGAETEGLLRGANGEVLFHPLEVRDADMAEAVRCGLLLWNDDFECAHEIAQGIQSPTGSYWHGLCHRREGERGEGVESNLRNPRYWFRKVGDHPTFRALYSDGLEMLAVVPGGKQWHTALTRQQSWDPFLFIDWLQECEAGPCGSRTILEELQALEIRLLIQHCVSMARG